MDSLGTCSMFILTAERAVKSRGTLPAPLSYVRDMLFLTTSEDTLRHNSQDREIKRQWELDKQ